MQFYPFLLIICISVGICNCLNFTPMSLQFTDVRVCMPKSDYFTITNDRDIDVSIHNIASDSAQFHPVFPNTRILTPQESISVEVVFLPHFVESSYVNLVINSSQGAIDYEIVGHAVQNPYHLHPFMGLKLISGETYEQPIMIFNPHSDTLFIREVFTTEDFLTLFGSAVDGESGKREFGSMDLNLFQVGTKETAEIIRILISAQEPGDYHGYVHIRTDKGKSVVPVDVTILEAGLQPSIPTVDFGVLTSSTEENVVQFKLRNNGKLNVTVTEIVSVAPDPQLRIILTDSPVAVAGKESIVALLYYVSSRQGKVTGQLLVITDHPNPTMATLEVPYTATVLYGGVGFDLGSSQFVIPKIDSNASLAANSAIDRQLHFTNYFDEHISITAMSAESCHLYINIVSLPDSEHLTVAPLQKWTPVGLQLNVTKVRAELSGQMPYSCFLELWTNASSHRVPLSIADGRVFVVSAEQAMFLCKPNATLNGWCTSSNEFEFVVGRMSVASPRPVMAHFLNPNPIALSLTLSKSDVPVCLCLELLGPPPFNLASLAVDNNVSIGNMHGSIGKCLCSDSVPFVGANAAPGQPREVAASLDIPAVATFVLGFQLSISTAATSASFTLASQYQDIGLTVSYEPIVGAMSCGVESALDLSPSSTYDLADMKVCGVAAGLRERLSFVLRCTSTYAIEVPIQQVVISSDALAFQLQVSRKAVPPGGVEPQAAVAQIEADIICNPTIGCRQLKNYSSPDLLAVLQLRLIGRLLPLVRELPLRDGIHSLLTQLSGSFLADQLAAAHADQLKLRDALKVAFPLGLRLPPFFTILRTAVANVNVSSPDLELKLPIFMHPDSNVISIPAVREDTAVFVYIQVFNPFSSPMRIRMRQEEIAGVISSEDSRRSALSAAALHSFSTPENFAQSSVVPATHVAGDDNNSVTPFQSDGSTEEPVCSRPAHDDAAAAAGSKETWTFDNGLFIVRGAVAHSSPISKLPFLARKSSSSGGPKLRRPDSDNPYLVPSSKADEWIAMACTSVLIGPVLYAPSADEGYSGQRSSTTVYVANDITGVEKVEVRNEWGLERIAARASGDGTCAGAKNVCSELDGLGSPLDELIFWKERSSVSLSVQNLSPLPVLVADILLDGRSCSDSEGEESAREVLSGCESLPKVLSPSEVWTLSAELSSDCAVDSEKRKFTFLARASSETVASDFFGHRDFWAPQKFLLAEVVLNTRLAANRIEQCASQAQFDRTAGLVNETNLAFCALLLVLFLSLTVATHLLRWDLTYFGRDFSRPPPQSGRRFDFKTVPAGKFGPGNHAQPPHETSAPGRRTMYFKAGAVQLDDLALPAVQNLDRTTSAVVAVLREREKARLAGSAVEEAVPDEKAVGALETADLATRSSTEDSATKPLSPVVRTIAKPVSPQVDSLASSPLALATSALSPQVGSLPRVIGPSVSPKNSPPLQFFAAHQSTATSFSPDHLEGDLLTGLRNPISPPRSGLTEVPMSGHAEYACSPSLSFAMRNPEMAASSPLSLWMQPLTTASNGAPDFEPLPPPGYSSLATGRQQFLDDLSWAQAPSVGLGMPLATMDDSSNASSLFSYSLFGERQQEHWLNLSAAFLVSDDEIIPDAGDATPMQDLSTALGMRSSRALEASNPFESGGFFGDHMGGQSNELLGPLEANDDR